MFLTVLALLPLCEALYSDLWLATKQKQIYHDILPAAWQHDIDRNLPGDQHLFLSCAAYDRAAELKSYLSKSHSENDIHPTYFSKSENRVCYTHFGDRSVDSHSAFTSTMIPHALKIDETVIELARAPSSGCTEFVLEIAVGLGVQGKGLRDHSHRVVSSDIMERAHQAVSDKNLLNDIRADFFWTSDSHSAVHRLTSHEHFSSRRNLFQQALSSHQCGDMADYGVNILRSHVSISSPQCSQIASTPVQAVSSLRSSPTASSGPPSAASRSHCLLLLTAVAAMHPAVSHVSAHRPEASVGTQSDDYSVGAPATDQNSWIQIGNRNISDGSSSTPYSDAGLDGSNMVLGMIDSGLDDLSCFMIDYSGTPTTRTPADQYASPVTEPYRRKVIQYVAWADGEPVLSPDNYDHGTWCGGSSVGRCIDSQANVNSSSYNGLAPNAQITMFDVDNNGSFYNVPSLYNIALPPAYEAGARVHSNSWGTPNMGSYTSKALDVDEYMLENPEFLFVVAAGNDGRQGFTSVHSPGVSKNALTVGAGAVDHEYLTSFSSMGYDYDNRMIKPNIITPGTNLMSAGVRQSGQTDSCNVQQSSGTSMATPLAAASAILIKQYFENTSFWASTCDTTYRSCPLVSSGAISGALIKAAVIHSGEGMAGYESSSTALVKSFAFDAPPDKYQGWGQVLLTNVLPLEGVEDFDLYVADGEQVESFTEIRYRVVVEGTGVSLRATIVWIDPSNVMWAAKNLLNDLDLQVISPLGNVSYGNNIQGDEFNPVERVVIDTPMIGVYEVSVIAKQLVGPSQTYAIVISCDGYVDESQTSGMVPVDQSNVNYEEDTVHCLRQQQFDGPEFQLVRLQLEDWDMGASWENMSVWVYESNEDGDKLGSAFNCTFIPNADRNVSASNKIFQCTACLESDALYVAELALSPDAPAGAALNMQHVRVATPDCYNVFLSNFQPIVPMQLSGSDCNACGDGSLVMNVLMFSNVTDDDSADYTWYGLANYTIRDDHDRLVAAGTLMVSDEQEDWYCLPQGKYTVALDDSALYSERIKHAKVVFSSAYGTTTNVTLQGTSSSVYYLGNYNTKSNDDDKSAWYESTGFIVGMTVGGLVFLCIAVCCIKSFFFPYKKKELETNLIP